MYYITKVSNTFSFMVLVLVYYNNPALLSRYSVLVIKKPISFVWTSLNSS